MKKILFSLLVLVGITATAQVKVGNNPTTIDTGTTNFQVEGTTTAEQFVVLKNGNVGIGTTTPNVKTEISGPDAIVSLRVNTQNAGSSSSNYSEVQLADNGALRSFWRSVRDGSGKVNFGYNNHLAFLSNSGATPIERVRFDFNGNVGIGTTTPSEKLDVAGSIKMVDGNQAAGAFMISDANGKGTWTPAATALGAASSKWTNDATNTRVALTNLSDGTTARTAGTEFVVTDAGNVGIGTATPGSEFHVRTEKNGVVQLYFQNAFNGPDAESRLSLVTYGGFGGLQLFSNTDISYPSDLNIFNNSGNITLTANGSSGRDFTLLKSNGNVGIGTANPGSKLSVVGLPVHASNAAAITAGLVAGDFFHAGDGIVRVVF